MVDRASVNFGAAYRNLQKVASDNPEWFDFARSVLLRTNDGKQLLLAALTEALKEAHEMRAPPVQGRPVPAEEQAPRRRRAATPLPPRAPLIKRVTRSRS